jgi:ParB family transcriptional regulator, chromosome partitioning protein
MPTPRGDHCVTIRVDAIHPCAGGPPRRKLDERRIRALAARLQRSGVEEPLVVAPSATEPDRFEIVAGEHRWRAAQLAGLEEVPCFIDPALGVERRRLLAEAAEALPRSELDAVQEAELLVKLMRALRLDASEAGALIGRSYKQVRRLVQIHGAIPPIKAAVVEKRVDARAALELVRIYNRLARRGTHGCEEAQAQVEQLIGLVVDERWSIRKLEGYARTLEEGRAPGPREENGERVAVEPLFQETKGKLVIDMVRLARGELDAKERSKLIELLGDLLYRVQHHP